MYAAIPIPEAPKGDDKPTAEFLRALRTAVVKLQEAQADVEAQRAELEEKHKALDHRLAEVSESIEPPHAGIPGEIRIDPLVFPGKLVSASSSAATMYKFTEQKLVDGTVGDFTDSHRSSGSSDYTARELNGWENLPAGRKVMVVHVVDPVTRASEYLYFISIPPPPLQDGSTDYALTYSKDTFDLAWKEFDDCAE